MALKINYKDDGFTGNRKYRQVTNADGTLSFEDVTAYDPVGDNFGAKDINATNVEINKIEAVKTATLTAAGWSAAYPYTQTVNVAGMTAADNPVLVKALIGTETEAVTKAYNKAFGLIFYGDTGAGTATFKALKKPEVNITVGLKGV